MGYLVMAQTDISISPPLQYQTQIPALLQNSSYRPSARRIDQTSVNIQYHTSILTKLADSATYPLQLFSL